MIVKYQTHIRRWQMSHSRPEACTGCAKWRYFIPLFAIAPHLNLKKRGVVPRTMGVAPEIFFVPSVRDATPI